MNLLAIEVETSHVRAAVLDSDSAEPIGGISVANLALEAPTSDAAQISAANLWEAVSGAARHAVQLAGVAGRAGVDVGAVGLSSFMPGLVLLGKDDRPLGPIWTHQDRRSRPAARQVWAHVGEELLASAGNRPLPGLMSALAWRQQHSCDPYLSHRVASYLHVNGWPGWRFT